MPKQPYPKGIYERNGWLWVRYTGADGQRVRRPTGIHTSQGKSGEQEAEALLGKWKAEAHAQKMWGVPPEPTPEPAPPEYTFDDVMLQYFQDRVSQQRGGINRAKATAKPLYEAFTLRPMRSITDADIKAYIRARLGQGEAPATINKQIGQLSAACNHAREELGWDIPNPATKKKLREPQGRVRHLEPHQAVRLIQAAATITRAPWLADFIQLAINTGCRSGELLHLEWNRVNFRTNLFILEETHTKTARRRSVPFNESARDALLSRARFRAQHCPASPWVFAHEDGTRINSVKRSFATALKLAGITDFRIHDQRHTCAALMIEEGASLPEIRDALGHSTITMTERYAHLAPERVRAALGRIRGVAQKGHKIEEKENGPHPKKEVSR